jgi:hypothetical protein
LINLFKAIMLEIQTLYTIYKWSLEKLPPFSQAHNPNTHFSSMNFSIITNIFVGMSKYPHIKCNANLQNFSCFLISFCLFFLQ